MRSQFALARIDQNPKYTMWAGNLHGYREARPHGVFARPLSTYTRPPVPSTVSIRRPNVAERTVASWMAAAIDGISERTWGMRAPPWAAADVAMPPTTTVTAAAVTKIRHPPSYL